MDDQSPAMSQQSREKHGKAIAPPTESVNQDQSKRSVGGGFALLVAVMALVVASGAGFFSWQTQQQLRQTGVVAQQTDHTLDTLQSGLREQQQRIAAQQQRFSQLQAALNHLRLKSEADTEAWVLAEVEYLLNIANYNLTFDANVAVAKKVLSVADARLQGVPHGSFTPLRAAIAKDLLKLDGVARVDREGIVLRLAALSQQIRELPLTDQTISTPTEADSEGGTSQPRADWRKTLTDSWSTLKRAVVIRRLDQPLQPLLAPEQHANLVENIQFQLNIAAWAVLHRDAKLYQHALHISASMIKDYLKQTDSTKAVLTGLERLQGINIAPVVPTLSASLQAVKQAINQKVQTPAVAPTEQAAPSALRLPTNALPQVFES